MSLNMDKIIDKSVKKLIKTCLKKNHRSLFIILGSQASNQVPELFRLFLHYKVKDPSVLWCTTKDPDSFQPFSKEDVCKWKSVLNSQESCILTPEVSSFNDVQRISERSFNFVILQDFDIDSLSSLPVISNSVKGGGVILFLFTTVQDLEGLSYLYLHDHGTPRLSRLYKRFTHLLTSVPGSLILDDNLHILSSGPKTSSAEEQSSQTELIEELRLKNESDPVISSLINVCRTIDQADLLVKFLDVLKKKTNGSVCSASSAVGRGKSAALGLAIAGSLSLNYSNIFISSMCYDDVKVLFKFLLKGLDVLNYKEDVDYDLIESVNPKLQNALTGINVFKNHPQSVRFIFAKDIGHRLDQAELVVFDEVAAVPQPMLKNVSGHYVTLMAASTVGPNASSPSLYETLVNKLKPSTSTSLEIERLQQVTLNEPIHYSSGDGVESWMNKVFGVDLHIAPYLMCGFPVPEECQLFSVHRTTLFSGNSETEEFLKALSSILLSSCPKMDPSHLQKMADSPDYRIFCLLPPTTESMRASSAIICAILVHLEDKMPESIIHCGTNLSGPVPHCINMWQEAVNTNTSDFRICKGVHVLNIVTHPSYRKMGYGVHALQLLQAFYEGKCIDLEEKPGVYCVTDELSIQPEDDKKYPLLLQLTEVEPEPASYLTVSFALKAELLRFWKKVGFFPVYLSEGEDIEGDHVLFMLKNVVKDDSQNAFLSKSEKLRMQFQHHYSLHLGSEFSKLNASLALNLLHANSDFLPKFKELTKEDIDSLIKPHQMKSLEKYCHNLQDFFLAIQFIPTLTNLFFKKRFAGLQVPRVQEAILMSFGLQYKRAKEIAEDLGLPIQQIHSLLNRTIKKIGKHISGVIEADVAHAMDMGRKEEVIMTPLDVALNDELEEAAALIREKEEFDTQKLIDMDMSNFAIRGSDDDWQRALLSGRRTLVNIKSFSKISEKADSLPDRRPLQRGKFHRSKRGKFISKKRGK